MKERIISFYNAIRGKINNTAVQAAMIAIAYKESGMKPKNETSYSSTRKFSSFNSFAKLKPYTTEGPNGIETSPFINELKKKDTTFYNFIYGELNGNDPKTAKANPIIIDNGDGRTVTVYDDPNGDGYKYRGRGYNGITGVSNYENAKNDSGVDVITYPDRLNEIDTAAKAMLGYMDRLSKQKVAQSSNANNIFYQVYSNTPLANYDNNNYQKAYNTLFSINAGKAKSMQVHLSNAIKNKGYNDGYRILQSIFNAIRDGKIK
jgi:predicted chitinase